MSEQTKNEIIKALAYGETPEQAAEVEGIQVSDVQQIAVTDTAEIQAEREMLRKAGFLNG